jgi:hypothetical protein
VSTFTCYLPTVEEAVLEQIAQRSNLPPNRVVRLAVRALYCFAAEHGFDELEAKLALEAGRLAELDSPHAGARGS